MSWTPPRWQLFVLLMSSKGFSSAGFCRNRNWIPQLGLRPGCVSSHLHTLSAAPQDAAKQLSQTVTWPRENNWHSRTSRPSPVCSPRLYIHLSWTLLTTDFLTVQYFISLIKKMGHTECNCRRMNIYLCIFCFIDGFEIVVTFTVHDKYTMAHTGIHHSKHKRNAIIKDTTSNFCQACFLHYYYFFKTSSEWSRKT